MAGRLAGKRILVVEDEYFIASDLTQALQAEDGEIVGPVGRLDHGLDLIAEEAVDAAVLDINLDGTASYPLADRLAEQAVPCLLVTGYDDWSMPESYRDTPRVGKPFTAAAVLNRLIGLIEKAPAS